MMKAMNELKTGVPCGHAGCLNHTTHPCEGCGRIAGGALKIYPVTYVERLRADIAELKKENERLKDILKSAPNVTGTVK